MKVKPEHAELARDVRRACELDGVFRVGRPNGALTDLRAQLAARMDDHRGSDDPLVQAVIMVYDAEAGSF